MAKTKVAEDSSKVRKNIMLARGLEEKIKMAATRLNTSQSELISKAVTDFLKKGEEKKHPPIFNLSGAFECKHSDLSVKYKHYLTGAKRR